jgi:hypothetical protein
VRESVSGFRGAVVDREPGLALADLMTVGDDLAAPAQARFRTKKLVLVNMDGEPPGADVMRQIADSVWTWWFDVAPALLSEVALLVGYLGLLGRLVMPSTLGFDGMSVQCLLSYGAVHFARMWFSRSIDHDACVDNILLTACRCKGGRLC